MSDQERFKTASFLAVSGAEPAREWLPGMSDEDRRTIGYDVAAAEFAWPIGMPICRPLGDGLHELRSDLAGNKISRVFFCVAEGHMVSLHDMMEKTQAISRTDLDLAHKRIEEVSPRPRTRISAPASTMS